MKKAKRILVGLKDAASAIPLTDIACRVGARGATLRLVHVIELPDITPLDADVPELEAQGTKILRSAERVAKRSRMKVESVTLRAHSAGDAILDELRSRKFDLAVLGYHHEKSLGEILLGTSAKRIMNHAPCQVLLSVPPRK